MAITDRLLAPVAIQNQENHVLGVDLAALVTRLLLFPTYIVYSVQLDELPFLVNIFGESGVIRLLEEDALTLLFNTYTIGQLGQARADLNFSGNRTRLPLGSYSFSVVKAAYEEQILDDKLNKTDTRLSQLIRPKLVSTPADLSKTVFDGFYGDIRKNPSMIESAIGWELKRWGAIPKQVRVRLEEIAPEDFQVASNLKSEYFMPEENVHTVIERALLAIADLNVRFAQMKAYDALSGIKDQDRPLLQGKLEAVARLVDSSNHERRFDRVREIAGLQTVAVGATKVDAEKLIKVRSSDECRAFRDWLRSTGKLSDSELKERLTGLNSRIREAVNSQPGKIIRFAISSGLSSLLTPLAGLGVSAVDSFFNR